MQFLLAKETANAAPRQPTVLRWARRRKALGIHLAYVYTQRVSDVIPDKPKRKAMFLGPVALRNLQLAASRRRTEREAVEEALALLVERDAQMDAMADFVDAAVAEWGSPTDEQRATADKIWSSR